MNWTYYRCNSSSPVALWNFGVNFRMIGRSNFLRSVRYLRLLSHCGCSTEVSTWYAKYVRPTENNCWNFEKRRVAGGIYESVSLCLRNGRRDRREYFWTLRDLFSARSWKCWSANSSVFFTCSCSSIFCRSVVNIWRCFSILDSRFLLIL